MVCLLFFIFVFLFDDCLSVCSPEAEAGVKALDGRWFGGKTVKAELYDEAKFKANQLSE